MPIVPRPGFRNATSEVPAPAAKGVGKARLSSGASWMIWTDAVYHGARACTVPRTVHMATGEYLELGALL